MKERLKAPELRFPGFTDDWEERKVKDIFKITRGQVLAATETSEEKSDISPFPVYSSQTKNNGLMGYYKDYLFDTAITWTTDGANAGTVRYRSGRFYSTNVNGVLISDKGYTNKAISEILNLEAWKWVSHVGNPKLMNNVMGDISIMIPSSFEEQDRLSDFLNQLDDTIALHQRKLDLLKEQKKGYLQKMFPKNGAKVPELRFAGFADDWEEHKVSEITDFHKQGFYTKESYNENKKYYLLRGTDMTSNKLILKDTPKINASEKDYEDFKVLKDDFLIVRSGTVGTYAIVKSDITAIFGSYLINFRFNQSIVLNEFFGLFYQSSLFKSQLNKIIQKSSNVNINAENIKSTNIKFPTIEEQQKIGAFFQSIDDTIALHQRKLDLLKEQKKGFLQKMFV
ncbi:restriction endonuclease subunit S [Lactococcus formosensis]|uniref:restriction endonuclease subunit S n=1 Tax=Lactococcus formosensis TaxID=1281486 RepID=UPI0022E8794A|nr:restriction endonuclease subunit S [Lactococcus formosensis]MDT2725459.1 restriction endonuclease subunit S [Lactococcus formosensis]